jgi:tetratricopeptide (TPR) repeat protein
MGILHFFCSTSYAALEHRGDRHIQDQRWGAAKIDYQRALDKLKKSLPDAADEIERLWGKMRRASEKLAETHLGDGDGLLERGFFDEARELFELALELTENQDLTAALETRLQRIDHPLDDGVHHQALEATETVSTAADETAETGDDENFEALCGLLPEQLQEAYRGYGASFRSGYLALHQGDFDRAADLLEQAVAEQAGREGYIGLELATAYYHLGRNDAAAQLLGELLQRYPDALPAYQLLCEIWWEREAFDRADALLDSCPPELRDSIAYYLLWGETLCRSGRYEEARSWYLKLLDKHGFNEKIAEALAKTYETMGEKKLALDMYGLILGQCRTCRSQPSMDVKRRFAELAFEAGGCEDGLLELYLSMVHQDRINATLYFSRISEIYARQGHSGESRRFRKLADAAKNCASPPA